VGVPVSGRRARFDETAGGRVQHKADAQRALQNKLARLLPGGRAMTMTLGEWVEE
jgi:hypothetical protein